MTIQLTTCAGCSHPILLSERMKRVYLPTGKTADMHDTPACVKAWKQQREDEEREKVACLGYD